MKKRALSLTLLCSIGSFSVFAQVSARPDTASVAAADSAMVLEDQAAKQAMQVFRSKLPLYEQRLDSIEKSVPLDYNEFVRSHIELYTYKRQSLVSRMMGLSEYYFPIFEQALKEKGLPLELKYLSIVESALDPNAVSRVGATGLWQFMYTTAREYGLQMNSYIDERKDPVAASRAAAEYLNNMYGRYGDWLLAIASYNCGSGNVDRAIYRAGGKLDFWAIRPYLPRETRNYVPAYIAVTYIMNYAGQHHIYPEPAELAFKSEPVQVEKYVSLSNLSKMLDMDAAQLCLLNPKYKRRIVNGSGAHPQTVWLPPAKAARYASLGQAGGEAKVITASNKAASGKKEESSEPVYYRVKSGDNLIAVANRFRCTVQDLKVWNDLPSSRLVPGQKLKVREAEESRQSKPRTYIAKTYEVKRGDTLYDIARRFNTSVTILKELNGINSSEGLRVGKIIKVNPEG